ncbi:MAG: hypothetical protein U9N47_01725 [Thermodesulfobacteriota bacterium]|nr:hypothetical protein [Thermodesulfobacteriota bacterium]
MLNGEELLAGGTLDFEVEIPADILHPAGQQQDDTHAGNTVRLRPLTVHDLQLISRAAKESDSLMATLMIQRALVEPQMSIAQVSAMHIGLVQYLLQHVNEISGITASQKQINEAADAPLIKAAFVLAKEFGWTPQQVNELTLGQVLLNLQMLRGKHDLEAKQ